MNEQNKLACVLAARDAGTKAVVKAWQRAHKCQFLQLRYAAQVRVMSVCCTANSQHNNKLNC